MDEFKSRRELLAQQMAKNSIAIIFAASVTHRNRDTDYLFRQNSNFYYFTGITEPEAIILLLKANNSYKSIAFVSPKDLKQEIWTGQRLGCDKVKTDYYLDECYELAKLEEKLKAYAEIFNILYYPFADITIDHEKKLKKLWKHGKVDDLSNISDNMRLIKSENELTALAKVADISAKAHIELMQSCKFSEYEYQLQAIFYKNCISNGCQDLAYPSIVAAGENACTLHYTENREKLKASDMLLVDAGGELNCYASDITRSYPVNGKFTNAQQDLYIAVLQAQLAGIDVCVPGNTIEDIQQAILAKMVPSLISLKILHGKARDIIKQSKYKDVYMHSCSHFLGLDVHDVGAYKENSQPRKLEKGMVLTIEPGVYLGSHLQDIPKEFSGMGIRIEDTVAITARSCNILSSAAPKSIEDIERLMQ